MQRLKQRVVEYNRATTVPSVLYTSTAVSGVAVRAEVVGIGLPSVVTSYLVCDTSILLSRACCVVLLPRPDLLLKRAMRYVFPPAEICFWQ